MAGWLTGTTVWLLVGTIVVYGFYIGDTADSTGAVREHFDGERAVATTGGDGGQPPRTARIVAVVGLDVSERLALWANRTDDTLVGDGIECLALLSLPIKPARAAAATAREVATP